MNSGSQGRAIVQIDNGYLSAVLRDEFGEPRISYRKLSEILCQGYSRLRTYVYDCMPYKADPPTPEQRSLYAGKQSFFSALKREPAFEIRFGQLRPRPTGPVQKGVDVLLAIDLVQLASKNLIQKAILVAGDADYTPAVKVARDEAVSVHLYHSGGTQLIQGRHIRKYSDELWDACDDRTVIDSKLIDACKIV
jgi:uncharacterized LabA/DUF88 family protein